MKKCGDGCYDVCNHCGYYADAGVDGDFAGEGICANPDSTAHNTEVYASGGCDDFVCSSLSEKVQQ